MLDKSVREEARQLYSAAAARSGVVNVNKIARQIGASYRLSTHELSELMELLIQAAEAESLPVEFGEDGACSESPR